MPRIVAPRPDEKRASTNNPKNRITREIDDTSVTLNFNDTGHIDMENHLFPKLV